MTQFQDERDERGDTEHDGLMRQRFAARVQHVLHPMLSSTHAVVPLVDLPPEHAASLVRALAVPDAAWSNLDEPLDVFEERWQAVRSEPYVPIAGDGTKSPDAQGCYAGLISSFQDMPGR